MSGELLRVRIDLGCSIVTVVRRLGTPSSASTWSSHSPSATRSWRLKRVGVGLRVAPRPSLDSTGMLPFYAGMENVTRTLFPARNPLLRRNDSVGWQTECVHQNVIFRSPESQCRIANSRGQQGLTEPKGKRFMRKYLLAATAVAVISAPAFAAAKGPYVGFEGGAILPEGTDL